MRYYPLVSEHTVETAGISELIEYTLPVNTQSPLSIKYNIDPSIDFTPHSFLQSLRVENGPYVPTQIEILHQYVSLPGFHFLKLSGEGVIALREEWRDDWQVWGTTSEYLTVNGVHPGWHLLVGENPHRVLIFSPQALISNWWPAFIFLELCLLAAIRIWNKNQKKHREKLQNIEP